NDNVQTDVENVTGGSGDDQITGSAGNNQLDGGAGDDTLDGGLGADTFIGGAGHDTADYSSRSENLRITIDDVANDGAAGEMDDVQLTIEIVKSGSGNDSITGTANDEVIYGGAGDDTLDGGAGGDDTLYGDAGDDTLKSQDGAGDDVLDGGTGTNTADMDNDPMVAQDTAVNINVYL